MPWPDDLRQLRAQLKDSGYDRQMAQAAERRRLLERFADRLSVQDMLNRMNDALLDGGGSVIVARSWQYDFDGEDSPATEDEQTDEIVYTLYWHDGEPVELAAQVGIDGSDSGYIIVDDLEVELAEDDAGDIAALGAALLEAFRDLTDTPDPDAEAAESDR